MRHILIILFIFLISFTIFSCGDDEEESTENSDTTSPTVSSTSPSDSSTSVPISSSISVTFSEAMDNTSFTTNTSNTTCSGTFQVSSDSFSSCVQMTSSPTSSNVDKTLTVDPSSNLSYATSYKIRVTTGVKDDGAANNLSSQYETGTGFRPKICFLLLWVRLEPSSPHRTMEPRGLQGLQDQ